MKIPYQITFIMNNDEEREAKEGLDKFLAKIDEVGSLVQGLVTSTNDASSTDALKKADNYLMKSSKEECKTKQDRLVINKATPQSEPTDEQVNAASFCRSVEEDAKERAERRNEREVKGKDLKRKGNSFFKSGDYEKALKCFADALQETPWDVTLYTNRALTLNNLQRYNAACDECDKALRIDPAVVKAYVHKANALKALNDVGKARECLTTALKECPTHKKDLQPYLDRLNKAS